MLYTTRYCTTRYVVTLVLGYCCLFSAIANANDLELLKVAVARNRSNLGAIRTWKGTARVHNKWTHKKAPPAQPVEQTTTAMVTFVYDALSGNLRSDYVLEESTNRFRDGTTSTYLMHDVYTMVKDGTFYSFRVYPPGRTGLVKREGPNGELISKLASGRNVRRSVLVFAKPPADLARQVDHFDPICRMCPKRESIIETSFEGWYEMLQRQSDLPDGMVSQVGSVVKFWIGPGEDTTCNVYKVDLEKGACIVDYWTLQNGEVTCEFTLRPQRVNGIWIPEKTTRVTNTSSVARIEKVDWLENELNEPLQEDEFTLVKMQLHRGDLIEDKRTGTMTKIVGMEFPPAPNYGEEVESSSSRRLWYIAIASSSLILVGVIGFWWTRRRRGTS